MAKDSTDNSPACENCKFSRSGIRPDKTMFLKCCRHAPVVNPVVMTEPIMQGGMPVGINKTVLAPTGWPEVQNDWWCGEYERQLH